jgi:3-hydroxy-9,10-secoandrosta-1,3,5(10)-triene-9,17-dione monooxygenase reductase component
VSAAGHTAVLAAAAETPAAAGLAPAAFGTTALRRTLRRFATGVTLVTAADESGPLGLVVNAFTSISLEPPLIAISPSRSSFTWSRIRRRGRFGVNVLAAEHADYVRRAVLPEADRFAGLEHERRASGVPHIRNAIAFLECEPVSEHLAGDHWIVVARVHELLAEESRDPLVFCNGQLGTFVSLESSVR